MLINSHNEILPKEFPLQILSVPKSQIQILKNTNSNVFDPIPGTHHTHWYTPHTLVHTTYTGTHHIHWYTPHTHYTLIYIIYCYILFPMLS